VPTLLVACCFCVESSAQTPPPSADLEATIAALGFQVFVGDTVFYSALIRNLGPAAANDVAFRIETPPGTTFESVSGGAGFSETTCTTPPVGSTGTISCIRGLMPRGSVVSMGMRLRVSPALAGIFFQTGVTVSSSVPDSNLSNNSASSTVLALAPGAHSDLSIEIVAVPNPVLPGQVLTHEIRVTNHGPDPTTNVQFGIRGLYQIESLIAEAPAGWACNYVPVGIPPPDFEFMVCVAPFFDIGTVTLRLRSTVLTSANFPIFLGLRLSSAALDPVAANNEATLVTPLGTGSGVPVPMLPPALLAMLALLFAVLGVRAQRAQ